MIPVDTFNFPLKIFNGPKIGAFSLVKWKNLTDQERQEVLPGQFFDSSEFGSSIHMRAFVQLRKHLRPATNIKIFMK